MFYFIMSIVILNAESFVLYSAGVTATSWKWWVIMLLTVCYADCLVSDDRKDR